MAAYQNKKTTTLKTKKERKPVAGASVSGMAGCGRRGYVTAWQYKRNVSVMTGRAYGFIHAASSSHGRHPSLLNAYHVAGCRTGWPYSVGSSARVAAVTVRLPPTVVVAPTMWPGVARTVLAALSCLPRCLPCRRLRWCHWSRWMTCRPVGVFDDVDCVTWRRQRHRRRLTL